MDSRSSGRYSASDRGAICSTFSGAGPGLAMIACTVAPIWHRRSSNSVETLAWGQLGSFRRSLVQARGSYPAIWYCVSENLKSGSESVFWHTTPSGARMER